MRNYSIDIAHEVFGETEIVDTLTMAAENELEVEAMATAKLKGGEFILDITDLGKIKNDKSENSQLATIELKARAFDMLMAIMDKQSALIACYDEEIPTPYDPIKAEYGSLLAMGSIKTRTVKVYEWRVRLKNRTDLKAVLLEDAAKR